MANRMSTYSQASSSVAPRSTAQQSHQVSTTTLLNSLHTAYTSGEAYALEASTSLVVNTWQTASGDQGTIDASLAQKAWEHARRRAEDGCIVLGSLHRSTPSVMTPFLAALPLQIPSTLHTALAVLRAFTTHATPANAATARHAALSATFTLTLAGALAGAEVRLAGAGLDVQAGLLGVSAEPGHRAFDVFYYLLTAASTPAEREFLGLKRAQEYTLLSRSGTYDPPAYLPAADDAAAAEDFRAGLRALGIKGAAHRSLLAVLAGLLKLGDTLGFLIDAEELDDTCEEVGELLGVDPEILARKCSTDDRAVLVAGLYEALVDWVVQRANAAIRDEVQATRATSTPFADNGAAADDDDGDTVRLAVLEVPDPELGKALALRAVFDDRLGINAEMRDDGVEVVPAGSSVLKEMQNAVAAAAADLGAAAAEREHAQDRREAVLERVGVEAEPEGFLRAILYPRADGPVFTGRPDRFDLLAHALGSSRVWFHLSLHPTDEAPATLAAAAAAGAGAPGAGWSAGSVSRQLRAWRLPEWAHRRSRHLDFTADFELDEFALRYARLGCQEGRDGVEGWVLERGWSNGEAVVGKERVWIREAAWWEAEGMLDLKPEEQQFGGVGVGSGFHTPAGGLDTPYSGAGPGTGHAGYFAPGAAAAAGEGNESRDHLLARQPSFGDARRSVLGLTGAKSVAPTMARTLNTMPGDYGLGAKGDERRDYDGEYDGVLDPEMGDPKSVTTQPITWSRRLWVGLVWALTFWVPSPALRYVGRMKRPDVRMAWREKVVLVALILLLNGIIIFYIVVFGKLLCPNQDRAWDQRDLGFHQGANDFFVAVRGQVYDISNFWEQDHSEVNALPVTKDLMQPFAGQVLDELFPPLLSRGCAPFVKEADNVELVPNNTVSNPSAVHVSGARSPLQGSKLKDPNWYPSIFLPKMKQYYKGDLVWDLGNVSAQGKEDRRQWVVINQRVYDLTDYFNTIKKQNNLPQYDFLPPDVTALIQSSPGQDITKQWKGTQNFTQALNCMNNVFFKGIADFRQTPRCQVNNYILLAFTIILCAVILVKFLAALQFGSKRRPAPQDKFVICQVPAYTEGEDQLRKGLDSLTALQYDNKRKLIVVICDGMIVGGGNDRPTPKIVLDILGVDPKIDPPALPFRSVGAGSEQLNYGKVYSGLYEYEGSVVPYLVVVKVGKESEQAKSKPGNRGKRDSQILLLSFLNRVHHRGAMSPLELEMFHQINNIIGVDPELYEYLFMVDADTAVREDSLNRLVASCANDAKIAGICGETSLQNEERSWWTMIQVYEYYISHHLAKAFESLFGSVTCLPGCFCMYRLRTADKGRPLIIADRVLAEYSDGEVDTLHKKNLLSLGEDRYLTTLMTKHFPAMSYKFVADAYAATAAPETWGVLLSQRRRWINSTIHNLAELIFLRDLCGFCCFSMRFVVFIDLFGTIILPATCAYLGYIVYLVASRSGQFPTISIVMLAAVYGLQALVFILRRQWQHVGWMIIYILAFPVYSFVLPLYSFWMQDDFSWGNTRVVIGEKGSKQVVALADDGGFDPRSIPLQRWDDYAAANNLAGRRGGGGGAGMAAPMMMSPGAEKAFDQPYHDAPGGYEMDDMQSMYSSVKPASTILTGMPHLPPGGAHGAPGVGPYATPQSPGAFNNRQSTMTGLTRFADMPQYAPSHHASPSPVLQMQQAQQQQQAALYRQSMAATSTGRLSHMPGATPSQDNLLLMGGGQPSPTARRSPLGTSRPVSTALPDFRAGPGGVGGGPGDDVIVDAIRGCLAEVDLDTITKKQVRALVEQRLQTEIAGERRAFLDRQIDAELANM